MVDLAYVVHHHSLLVDDPFAYSFIIEVPKIQRVLIRRHPLLEQLQVEYLRAKILIDSLLCLIIIRSLPEHNPHSINDNADALIHLVEVYRKNGDFSRYVEVGLGGYLGGLFLELVVVEVDAGCQPADGDDLVGLEVVEELGDWFALGKFLVFFLTGLGDTG